jgi:uncharacterized membrane protein YdjX (TVP38/TMEM64 family)
VIHAAHGDRMQPDAAGETEKRPVWSPWRLWPLLPIAVALIVFFALDLQRFVSLSALKENQTAWRGCIEENTVAAVLVFMAIYTALVAFSIPAAVFVTLIGGFLFGAAVAFPMIVVSATLGSTLIFLAARSSLGGLFEAKAGPWLARLEQGFRRDQWSYMFFLRLTPLVPFFIVNFVPAFLGVDLICFVVATFFGIMPVTLIYTLAGAEIGEALQAENLSIESILTPKFILALTGLGIVAILPAILRRFRRKVP